MRLENVNRKHLREHICFYFKSQNWKIYFPQQLQGCSRTYMKYYKLHQSAVCILLDKNTLYCFKETQGTRTKTQECRQPGGESTQ